MDTKLLYDVLKYAGLPGMAIFGWLVAVITHNPAHDNWLLWGGILATSIAVNFLAFQLKEWQNTIIETLQSTIQDIKLRNTETLEALSANQNQMLINLAQVMATQSGKLSLDHVQLLLVYLCDAFKWRIWQVCLNAIDSRLLSSVTRSSLQSSIELQIKTSMKGLAQYNSFTGRADVNEILKNAITIIFDSLYDEDFAANDNLSYQVKTITYLIQDVFSDVFTKLRDCINRQRENTEIDNLLQHL